MYLRELEAAKAGHGDRIPTHGLLCIVLLSVCLSLHFFLVTGFNVLPNKSYIEGSGRTPTQNKGQRMYITLCCR